MNDELIFPFLDPSLLPVEHDVPLAHLSTVDEAQYQTPIHKRYLINDYTNDFDRMNYHTSFKNSYARYLKKHNPEVLSVEIDNRIWYTIAPSFTSYSISFLPVFNYLQSMLDRYKEVTLPDDIIKYPYFHDKRTMFNGKFTIFQVIKSEHALFYFLNNHDFTKEPLSHEQILSFLKSNTYQFESQFYNQLFTSSNKLHHEDVYSKIKEGFKGVLYNYNATRSIDIMKNLDLKITDYKIFNIPSSGWITTPQKAHSFFTNVTSKLAYYYLREKELESI